MGVLKEFKEFAIKGNLIDMAVGVVIGTAFGRVVSAFIEGMIMPLIGKVMNNVDFNNLYLGLSDAVNSAKTTNPTLTLEEAKKLGPVISYGTFITVVIDFIIIAFTVFVVIKTINKMKRKQEEAPAEVVVSKEEQLLSEMRDLLKIISSKNENK